MSAAPRAKCATCDDVFAPKQIGETWIWKRVGTDPRGLHGDDRMIWCSACASGGQLERLRTSPR